MLRTFAAVLALLLPTLSSHAALVASPQRPISAPGPGPAAIEKVLDVATDGTDFLTLWAEWAEPRRGMYAAVLNEQGVARAVTPDPIGPGFTLAHAVWTGDAYLVVHHPDVVGPPAAVRLDRDAQVISEHSVLDVGPGYVADLAWNGTRALAVVQSGRDLFGVLLDSRGRIRESRFSLTGQNVGVATVTRAGNGFLVAWSEELAPQGVGVSPLMRVLAAYVSASGEVLPHLELMAPTRASVHHLASASSGNDAGIAFTTRTLPEQFFRLHRLTIDGPTLAIDARPTFNVPDWTEAMAVVPVPGGFAATYAFYAAQGLRLGHVGFDSSARLSVAMGPVNIIRGMHLATNGSTVMSVFGDATAVAVTLNAGATERKSGPTPVSIATAQQGNPVLASSGNQMLAAWIEPDFPNGSVLLAQRRNANGDPLDAQPIVVTRGFVSDTPAIAFTGKVWLVAWPNAVSLDTHVFVKRISPEGVVLDATPVDVGTGWRRALASNGTVAALVMDKPRSAEIRLVRFSAEGEMLDSTALTATHPHNEDPSVATNGTEFLVTWHEERTSILGRRLAADGTPMDAAPVAIAQGGFLSRGGARVASNGTDFVVAYAQWEPIPIVDPPIVDLPPTIFRVFTKRVLRNGTLADSTAEQDGTLLGEGTMPQIAAFGDGYVATFIEAQEHPYDRLSLFALPLDGRGVPEAAPTAVLRNVRSYSNDYSVAVIGPRIEVAYSRLAPQLGNVHRVFLRALSEQASRRRPSGR